MKRKHLSRVARTRIFDAAGGMCCICRLPIDAQRERWIVEHVKPLWLGGADDDSNMAPAHKRCAIEKTRHEAPIKAKSDRVRAYHLGIRKSTSGKFPCGRNSPFKKRIDGTVVRRDA